MTDLTKLVKPLDWHEGDEPQEWKSGPYDVWHELGKFQVYWWSIVLGDPHDTEDAAKASANSHNTARIIAALDPSAVAKIREDALREAAQIVLKRADDYHSEHGSYDYSTDVTEYPGNGSEWMEEWEDIASAILALIKTSATQSEKDTTK